MAADFLIFLSTLFVSILIFVATSQGIERGMVSSLPTYALGICLEARKGNLKTLSDTSLPCGIASNIQEKASSDQLPGLQPLDSSWPACRPHAAGIAHLKSHKTVVACPEWPRLALA